MNEDQLHDYEAPELVNYLINFLGKKKLELALKRYKQSLLISGEIYRDYYLKFRHPWFEAFLLYKKLKNRNQLYLRKFNEDIMKLATDAKKIQIFSSFMPHSVLSKYQSDFLDVDNAVNYLFEINTAWHFHRKGFNIKWFETTNQRQPEFLIFNDSFEIEVECKRIGFDAFRKIRRPDFYRLCDHFINKLNKLKVTGSIVLNLDHKLQKSDTILKEIGDKIINLVESKCFNCEYRFNSFQIKINLTNVNNIIIDPQSFFNNFHSSKEPNSHGFVSFGGTKKYPSDPLTFTIKSAKSDNVLKGIKNKIKDACKLQLSKKKPGFISCFIPEISDFTGLEKNSGLSRIVSEIFLNENYNHVVAISFVSDARYSPTFYGRRTYSPALIFNNSKSKFDEIKKFHFGINEVN